MIRAALLALACCSCVSGDIAQIRDDLAAIERALPEAERTPQQAARLASISERIDGVAGVSDALEGVARSGAEAALGGGAQDWLGLGGSLAALAVAYRRLRKKAEEDDERTAQRVNEQRDAARRKRNEVVGDQLARSVPPNVAPPADAMPARETA